MIGDRQEAKPQDSGRPAPCPRRLAYVLSEFPSISETFILREILALRERGWEIQLYALRRGSSTKVHAGAVPLMSGVRYAPAPGCAARLLLRAPLRCLTLAGGLLARYADSPVALARALRRIPAAAHFARHAAESGIAHVHAHFAHVTADVAWMMARLLGARFSISAHAWDIYSSSPRTLEWKLRESAFVAVCTRYNADSLRSLFPRLAEEKVRVVYHGVNPGAFASGEAEGNLILAVGRLVEKKGFEVLVRACAQLRDAGVGFRCSVVGEGPERGRLEKAIAKFGVGASVSLRGEMTQEELAVLFREAAVFALPCVVTPHGDRDGLPNAILEAMASGLPVVSTRVSAVPEAVANEETGILVAPGDAGELARALKRLLGNRELRRRLGTEGRARVQARFDIRANAAELGRLFEGMAAMGGRKET